LPYAAPQGQPSQDNPPEPGPAAGLGWTDQHPRRSNVKLSNLVYATAGYVLGARAGRERYDQIVRIARRFAGSQTVQSTAGLMQAQLDQLAAHARQVVAAKLTGATQQQPAVVNGHRH
jgi:hypothetical protein